MAQAPDGIIFTVESKAAGQQKWQVEDQFTVDTANGYPEGNAQADALAAFQALYEGTRAARRNIGWCGALNSDMRRGQSKGKP